MKKLNCGNCTTCCKGDLIYLHNGDDPALYKVQDCDGRIILQHKPNGDCIYLDKGCSIYDRRPIICRELDCRKVYKMVKKNPGMQKFLQPDFMRAAKRAIRRSK